MIEADPKVVADIYANHFVSVSKKNPISLIARHRRDMESHGISFASSGGKSYNVVSNAP